MKQAFLSLLILSIHLNVLAASGRSSSADSKVTYDVSGSQSTKNGKDYQEINVGLNWFLQDWLIWRNSAFQRQGDSIKTLYGLDSSIRLQQEWMNSGRTLGFKIFGGPGIRAASISSNNAYFGEAGLGFRLGGINIAAGIKALRYYKNRVDEDNVILPKDENQVFVTISGSGIL
jgi:hypothetical protein